MIGWIILAGEGFHRLFNPTNVRMTLLFAVVTSLGFIASLALFRPHAHPRHWPPFILAVAVGVTTVVGWRMFKMICLRITQPLPYVMGYSIAWATLSFCSGTVWLLLDRLTLDRSRRS
jgi:hypothetical protein